VENWLFMRSPWPTVVITLLYLYLCQWGPKHLMGNREQCYETFWGANL
jgi:hypothetical protein